MSNKPGKHTKNASAALFFALSARKLLNWMPDELYLSTMWRTYFHKKFDWKNPQTFNEKIQWLKAKDHNPLYPALVDKFAVRQFIRDAVGEDYLIPLVGGPWNSFDEIDFSLLPERFVLKCTHDSGGVVICRGKDSFDRTAAREKIEKSLKRNYYWGGREWPYRDIQPRIIAEEYIGSSAGTEPTDYKFIMFGGELRCLFVTTNRFTGKKMNMTFFDADWNLLPFERMYSADPNTPVKPERYDEMIRIARHLSKGMALTRIDLYEIDRRVYFGEITLYPGSGMETFQPIEWDYKLGEWIDLKKYFPQEFQD
jgi:hypothetical protein